MKRNEITQLATKTEAELQTQLQVIHLELSKAKLAKSAGKLANLRSVGVLKDDVARIKTALTNLKNKPVAVETETKAKTSKKSKKAA